MIVIGLVESLSIMTECRGDGRRAGGGRKGVSVDEEAAPVGLLIDAHTFSGPNSPRFASLGSPQLNLTPPPKQLEFSPPTPQWG